MYKTYLTGLREHVLNAPNLTFAPQSVFAAKLELLIQSLLLIWAPNCLVSLATICVETNVRHLLSPSNNQSMTSATLTTRRTLRAKRWGRENSETKRPCGGLPVVLPGVPFPGSRVPGFPGFPGSCPYLRLIAEPSFFWE